MKTIAKQLDINNIERTVFWGLFMLLILIGISYAYFVNQTIFNIVQRENIEEEIVMLNSKISGLEFNYIALKNNITIDYAYSVGFHNVKNIKFASRKLLGQGLSLRGE